MKFSVFTVSTPDLTPAELVTTLKESGYNGVEWRLTKVPEAYKDEAPTCWRNNLCTIDLDITDTELDELLHLTQKESLEVSALLPYLIVGDLKGTEKVMRIAKKLGAKQIRVGQAWYDRTVNYNDLYDQMVKYLHGVQELSQTYGVKGLVETHHLTINPSAGLAHRLVSQFNPDHIGIMYDPGNMVYEGYENYRKGLQLIGSYLSHVHVKNVNLKLMEQPEDGTVWATLPDGSVEWKQVLLDLKSVGYDGYLGFEDFSLSKPTRELLKFNIDYIKTLLKQIS
jgi:sugar phosphate isomerase/epimerase